MIWNLRTCTQYVFYTCCYSYCKTVIFKLNYYSLIEVANFIMMHLTRKNFFLWVRKMAPESDVIHITVMKSFYCTVIDLANCIVNIFVRYVREMRWRGYDRYGGKCISKRLAWQRQRTQDCSQKAGALLALAKALKKLLDLAFVAIAL